MRFLPVFRKRFFKTVVSYQLTAMRRTARGLINFSCQRAAAAMSGGFLLLPILMTWTSQFGRGAGWLLQKIVNGLAISRISPNALTFIGLLINIGAALFF